ncbi:biotin--[acetyl-CoA-carboxylase] ligase [Altererythrobacter indicus]|uniref:biotin--[biotin carboxyl-carrier protein] ligase n=1 Tax=Altericroceibacterium indicum TaxID=374177 RepID=A0A845A7H8_9SPHN|nr:biotin--[acetyl-CoA-carboxylase] ligase [Altericroceibacterium indicum]MXP25299.1 biotin--[acetyl-CoA-carboxylase] ligase [Altericroceibacterium indicum]
MIEIIPETGSTNADLLARLAAGEEIAENYWLVTDTQTSGRGRQGRPWLSEPGNFFGSTCISLQASDPPPASLSFVIALAAYEALVPIMDRPDRLQLKWPNDVLMSGAKLAGILLEGRGRNIVIGIGVNLVSAPKIADRDIASIAGTGSRPDRDVFAHSLADSFRNEVAAWRDTGLEPLFKRWLSVAHPVGSPLAVHATDGSRIFGRFVGLAEDGALLLEDGDGGVHTLHAGDVMLGRN